MFVKNTFFQYKGIQKYTWSALSDKVEQRSIIDLIMGRGDILRDVYDLNTVRSMGERMFDYMVVLCMLS